MYFLRITKDEFENLSSNGTVAKKLYINTKNDNLKVFRRFNYILAGTSKSTAVKAVIINRKFIKKCNRIFKEFRIAFIRA